MVSPKKVLDTCAFLLSWKRPGLKVTKFMATLFTKYSMVAFPARWNCHLLILHKTDCINHLDFDLYFTPCDTTLQCCEEYVPKMQMSNKL